MFICVLKSGGIYTPNHVKRLQKQLDRNLFCLTDLDFHFPNVQTTPLKHNWKGWWSKIELFRMHGPITYLDLDVEIVGNPDRLHRQDFTMWQDPLYPEGVNSSVMSWQVTPVNVYEAFLKFGVNAAEKAYRRWPKAGDQGFIADHAGRIKRYETGLIKSYRNEVKKDGIDSNTVVVAYHGRPKPWELK